MEIPRNHRHISFFFADEHPVGHFQTTHSHSINFQFLHGCRVFWNVIVILKKILKKIVRIWQLMQVMCINEKFLMNVKRIFNNKFSTQVAKIAFNNFWSEWKSTRMPINRDNDYKKSTRSYNSFIFTSHSFSHWMTWWICWDLTL